MGNVFASITSLIRNENSSNWKKQAESIDAVVCAMISARFAQQEGASGDAQTGRVSELRTDTEPFFERNLTITEKSLRRLGRTDESSSNGAVAGGPVSSFSITVSKLLAEETGRAITPLFRDRYCIDTFGVRISETDLTNYRTFSDEEQDSIFVYGIPPIDEVLSHLQTICDSLWRSFSDAVRVKYLGVERYRTPAALFRFDPEPEVSIKEGEPVRYRFSHTKHLLQHLAAFIERGYVGAIWPKDTEKCYLVENPVGAVHILRELSREQVFEEYEVVVHASIYPSDFLINFRQCFNLFIQPAVHWVEGPEFFPVDHLTVVQAVAPIVDGVVSQNQHMLALTRSLLYCGGGRLPKDRYVEVPLRVWTPSGSREQHRRSTRRRYGFDKDTTAIVNGGGAWDWTATYEFMRDFCEYCTDNPDTKLRFVQMGLKQKENLDHDETVAKIRALLSRYRALVKKKYVIVEDWDKASRLLPEALSGFDYGFSASKISVEAFQAHRVRLTEYLQYSLPPIVNDFDYLRPILGAGAITVGMELNFKAALRTIEGDTHAMYERRVRAISNAVEQLNERGNSGKIVDLVEKHYGQRDDLNVRFVAERVSRILAGMYNMGIYDLRPDNVPPSLTQDIPPSGNVVRGIKDIVRGVLRLCYAIVPRGIGDAVLRRFSRLHQVVTTK